MSVLNSEPNEANPIAEDAHLIRASLMRLQRRMRAARGDLGIGLSAYSALACLYQHGPLCAGELAARERLQPQSLTRILARLEERGFIKRTPDQADLRRTQIRISRNGLGFLHRNALDQEAWLTRAIAETLTESERAMLRIAAQLLDRVADSSD